MSHSNKIATAALAAGLTMSPVACESTISGSSAPAEIDVRNLDTGPYPTEPRDAHDDDRPGFLFHDEIAAMRLADYVASGYDIDPRLKHSGRSGGFSSGSMDGLLGSDTITSSIAQRHTMLFGFLSQGSDTDAYVSSGSWPTKVDTNSTTVATMVMQFPDAERAALAATEFHHADLDDAKGQNQPVPLPKYPAAHAQWRPGSPFLRATLAHGPYVAAFLISTNRPVLPALTALAERAYETQLALLDQLKPITDEEMFTLPWDPDGLLNRALNPDHFLQPTSDDKQVVLGLRGILQYAEDRDFAKQQYTEMGADKFGVSYGTIVARTSGTEAAKKAVTDRITPFPTAQNAAAPPNLPDSACVENKNHESDYDRKRFTCIVAYHEYVAFVSSDQLLDAHQRAAAQYTIFANTR